jgi:hypothetical protein
VQIQQEELMTANKFIAIAAGAGLLLGAATAAMAQSSTTTQDPTPTQGRALGPQDEIQGPSKGPNNVGSSPRDHQTGQRNTLGTGAGTGGMNSGGAVGQSDDKKPGHN